MRVLSLDTLTPRRFVIIGEILGSYDMLISLLFQQNVNFEDIVIFTGNFVHADYQKSMDVINFIRSVRNVYSVLGKHEHSFVCTYMDKGADFLPLWMRINKDLEQHMKYLSQLPHVIALPKSMYVVNCGFEPHKPLEQQSDRVVYSIGAYEEGNEFYQFDNPEKKSWYDFKFWGNSTIIFSGTQTQDVEVPAGISLWRQIGEPLKCLIIDPVRGIQRVTTSL